MHGIWGSYKHDAYKVALYIFLVVDVKLIVVPESIFVHLSHGFQYLISSYNIYTANSFVLEQFMWCSWAFSSWCKTCKIEKAHLIRTFLLEDTNYAMSVCIVETFCMLRCIKLKMTIGAKFYNDKRWGYLKCYWVSD